jgi:hypothetical protein
MCEFGEDNEEAGCEVGCPDESVLGGGGGGGGGSGSSGGCRNPTGPASLSSPSAFAVKAGFSVPDSSLRIGRAGTSEGIHD